MILPDPRCLEDIAADGLLCQALVDQEFSRQFGTIHRASATPHPPIFTQGHPRYRHSVSLECVPVAGWTRPNVYSDRATGTITVEREGTEVARIHPDGRHITFSPEFLSSAARFRIPELQETVALTPTVFAAMRTLSGNSQIVWSSVLGGGPNRPDCLIALDLLPGDCAFFDGPGSTAFSGPGDRILPSLVRAAASLPVRRTAQRTPQREEGYSPTPDDLFSHLPEGMTAELLDRSIIGLATFAGLQVTRVDNPTNQFAAHRDESRTEPSFTDYTVSRTITLRVDSSRVAITHVFPAGTWPVELADIAADAYGLAREQQLFIEGKYPGSAIVFPPGQLTGRATLLPARLPLRTALIAGWLDAFGTWWWAHTHLQAAPDTYRPLRECGYTYGIVDLLRPCVYAPPSTAPGPGHDLLLDAAKIILGLWTDAPATGSLPHPDCAPGGTVALTDAEPLRLPPPSPAAVVATFDRRELPAELAGRAERIVSSYARFRGLRFTPGTPPTIGTSPGTRTVGTLTGAPGINVLVFITGPGAAPGSVILRAHADYERPSASL